MPRPERPHRRKAPVAPSHIVFMAPAIAAEVCTAELVGAMAETHSGAPLPSRRHLEPRRKIIERAASQYLTTALAALAATDPASEDARLSSLVSAIATEAVFLERGKLRRRKMERILHELFGPTPPPSAAPDEIATHRRLREQVSAVMVDVVHAQNAAGPLTAEGVQSFFLDPLRAVTRAPEPTPELMAMAQERLEALALRLSPAAGAAGGAMEALALQGGLPGRVAAGRLGLVRTVVTVLERWTKVPAAATYSPYAEEDAHAGPTVRALQLLLHSLAARLERAGGAGAQASVIAGVSPSAAALRRDLLAVKEKTG